MYVDPSAILAILKEEADAKVYRDRLMVAFNRVITVVGKVEAALALGRTIKDYAQSPQLITTFCLDADIVVAPVFPELYDEVLLADRRFGKGTGHPAQLNFGDCFSYAYAKLFGMPLLYKGGDFSKTDILSAL